MKLEGKTAIITGASRSIGKAIALDFAKNGADVIINYLNNFHDARKVVKEIEDLNRRAFPIQADVSKPSDVRKLMKESIDKFERIDILVNNAGVIHKHQLHKIPVQEWEHLLKINLNGPFLCSRLLVDHMIKEGGGNIINISSIAAFNPEIYTGAYSVSKAALNMLTQLQALEWARFNIRVNAICPGPVDTPMLSQALTSPEQVRARLEGLPLGRLGTPEEVAKVATFLASEDASNITGENIVMDGGSSKSMYYLINALGEFLKES